MSSVSAKSNVWLKGLGMTEGFITTCRVLIAPVSLGNRARLQWSEHWLSCMSCSGLQQHYRSASPARVSIL